MYFLANTRKSTVIRMVSILRKSFKVFGWLLLLALPALSWATTTLPDYDAVTASTLDYSINIFTPVSDSIAVYNLGLIFGSVGNLVSTSGSLLMAQIFTIFNYAGLSIVVVFVMYQVSLMWLQGSQDGAPMAGRLSFMPLFRISLATALLLPSYSGYSLANVLGMNYIVLYGNNMADNIWAYTLKYLYDTGGYVISGFASATDGDSSEYDDLTNMSYSFGIDPEIYYPSNLVTDATASAYNLYYSASCAEMLYQQYLSYCSSSSGENDTSICTQGYSASDFGAHIESATSSSSGKGELYYGGPIDNLNDDNTSMLYKGICGHYNFNDDGSYVTAAVTQMVNDIYLFVQPWIDDIVTTYDSCYSDNTSFTDCMSQYNIDYSCADDTDASACQPANALITAGSDFYNILEPERSADASSDESSWWGSTAVAQGWMSAGQHYRDLVGGAAGGTGMSTLASWPQSGQVDSVYNNGGTIQTNTCSTHDPSKAPDPFCAFSSSNRSEELMEAYTYLYPWYPSNNGLGSSVSSDITDIQGDVVTEDAPTNKYPNPPANYYSFAQQTVSNMAGSSTAANAQTNTSSGVSSADSATAALLQAFYYDNPEPSMNLYVDGFFLTNSQASKPLDYLTRVMMMDLTAITGLNFVNGSPSSVQGMVTSGLINYDSGSYKDCKDSSVKDICDSSDPSGCYAAASSNGCIVQGVGILGQMAAQDQGTYYDPIYVLNFMGGVMFNAAVQYFSDLIDELNSTIEDVTMKATGMMAGIMGVTAIMAAAASAFVGAEKASAGELLNGGIMLLGKIPILFIKVISDLDKAALFAYIPLSASLVTATLVTGATLAVWVQFIPYIVFTTAAISVFFTYIEFMIGTTLLAMGLAYEGHDFLGAAQGLMPIALSAFMGPTMVLTGFYVFILANYVFINYFNLMMLGVFGNTVSMFGDSGAWTRLFAIPSVTLFYVFALIEVITFNASLMTKFKNSLARFLGGQPEPDAGAGQAVQMLQSIRSSGEGATQQGASGAGGAAQSQASISPQDVSSLEPGKSKLLGGDSDKGDSNVSSNTSS